MNRLHVTRFGFATGTTVAVIYFGCILVSLCLGNEAIAKFFGYLAHGFDFAPILRTAPITITEAAIGIIQWFIIAWLSGASIAILYNSTLKTSKVK